MDEIEKGMLTKKRTRESTRMRMSVRGSRLKMNRKERKRNKWRESIRGEYWVHSLVFLQETSKGLVFYTKRERETVRMSGKKEWKRVKLLGFCLTEYAISSSCLLTTLFLLFKVDLLWRLRKKTHLLLKHKTTTKTDLPSYSPLFPSFSVPLSSFVSVLKIPIPLSSPCSPPSVLLVFIRALRPQESSCSFWERNP